MELALKWTGIIFTILGGIFTALGVCLSVFTGVLPLAMFAGFGLVFLLLGIGMLWARTRARARRAKLLEEGQRIDARHHCGGLGHALSRKRALPAGHSLPGRKPCRWLRICVSKRSVLVRPLPLPGRAIHSAGVCRWR